MIIPPTPPLCYLTLEQLQYRMAKSKTVKRAVRWQCRAQAFRRLPRAVRTVLGGKFTLLMLDIVADIALEEHLTEIMDWN